MHRLVLDISRLVFVVDPARLLSNEPPQFKESCVGVDTYLELGAILTVDSTL